MRVRFHDFAAEVPEGWRDESTITFTMPPDDRLTPMGQSGGGSPGNVVIGWQARRQQSVEAFVQERAAGLRKALPGFKLRAEGEIAPDVRFLEYTFSAPVPVVQLLVVRAVGDELVCVTGTAMAGRFAELRPVFEALARSVQKDRAG
jgi:hypothetical protein